MNKRKYYWWLMNFPLWMNFLTVCWSFTKLHLFVILQVILASLEQGVKEGRILLHDWLVILTAQYNEAYKLAHYENGSSSRTDVAFSQCPQLQPLPRLVFALLRSPLLQFHEEGVHPDYRIYLQCLFRYLILLLRALSFIQACVMNFV